MTSAFALPDHLTAKSDPALTAADEAHFAAISESLASTVADLEARLDAARKAPGGQWQAALDRQRLRRRLCHPRPCASGCYP